MSFSKLIYVFETYELIMWSQISILLIPSGIPFVSRQKHIRMSKTKCLWSLNCKFRFAPKKHSIHVGICRWNISFRAKNMFEWRKRNVCKALFVSLDSRQKKNIRFMFEIQFETQFWWNVITCWKNLVFYFIMYLCFFNLPRDTIWSVLLLSSWNFQEMLFLF